VSSSVQNLIETSLGNAARAAKYELIMNLPISLFPDNTTIDVLAKTSAFPGKSHDTIDIKFKGRSIPVKGQTKYEQTFECSFYLSEDHRLKQAFENWIESLDGTHNYSDSSSKEVKTAKKDNKENGYTKDITLYQLDFDLVAHPIKYVMYDCFPTVVSPVSLNAESRGEMLEFSVTFSYSYFDSFVGNETHNSSIKSQLSKLANDAIGSAVSKITAAADKAITSKVNNITSPVTQKINGTLNKISKFSSSMFD